MGRLGRAVLGEGLRLPLRLLASLLVHAAWLLRVRPEAGRVKATACGHCRPGPPASPHSCKAGNIWQGDGPIIVAQRAEILAVKEAQQISATLLAKGGGSNSDL